jgi:hypothetical protein
LVEHKYNWVFWAEWASTVILMIGVIYTSLNIYPTNIYWSLAGNLGWGIVAIAWKKWSLFTIQIILTAIYIVGLYTYYLT